MSRLPAAMFAALVVATVGAFFLSQHLKVSPPLVMGLTSPDPIAINPVSGRICENVLGERVSFRHTIVSFSVAQNDNVGVYVTNRVGQRVATLSDGRAMKQNVTGQFVWNGRESDGSVAPQGLYFFHVELLNEGVNIPMTQVHVTVITTPPHPVITSVHVAGAHATATNAGPAVITPPRQTAVIHFTKAEYRGAEITIWRTDLPGKPRAVAHSFVNPWEVGIATWDGKIDGSPAPAGTYLVGITVKDLACNLGTFPIAQPPAPGTTPEAGITVRYLAAQPPLTPVPAGSVATVYVDARQRAYSWKLWRPGARKPVSHGKSSGGYQLRVRIPGHAPGLYELAIRSGAHGTIVPLVASGTGTHAAAKVLVVLPALTWQGRNPVDDDGDGLPNTLTAGERILLERPLVGGLPHGFGDEESLLQYLDSQHMSYQLTTDVALAEGAGPRLGAHHGVILDGSLVWLPSSLAPALHDFVSTGGRVLAVGPGSLQAEAPISRTSTGLVAGPPSPLHPDPFGAGHGRLVGTQGQLITVLSDPLSIFGTSIAFPGFRTYQTITPPDGAVASMAGVAASAPTVTGFSVGRGEVVEVGLPGFGTSLPSSVDSQELLTRVWQVLSG